MKRRNLRLPERRGSFLRTAVAVLQLSAGAIFPHAAEARFWEERRQARAARRAADPSVLLAQLPAASPIPFTSSSPVSSRAGGSPAASPALSILSAAMGGHGFLREVYLSSRPNAPLIVHIQDAHEIESAQRHTAAIIENLSAGRPADAPLLAGLEGASGAFDTPLFRAYGRPAVMGAVMDYFLKTGYIGGAEFAAFTAAAPPLLWGVEDAGAYAANARAVREAEPLRAAWSERCSAAARDRGILTGRFYSAALLDLDRRIAEREAGGGSFGAHVRALSGIAGDPAAFPNAALLLRALDAESSLDFSAVEKERRRLAQALADRLPADALGELVRRSLSVRDRPEESGAYHRYLKELCESHGLRLSDFAGMPAYLDYLELTERIDRVALLSELPRLERAAEDALALSPEQKRLAAAGRRLRLLRKLVDHAMAPEDWAEYGREREAVLRLPEELVSLGASAGPAWKAAELAPFEDFCRLALDRNRSLVDNLLKKAGERRSPAGFPGAVLVAGGFHSDGLVRLLRERGVSVAVVCPRVEDAPRGPPSFDAFTRAPLPLEKLFAGEVISLARWRYSASAQPALAGAAGQAGAFRVMAASLPAAVESFGLDRPLPPGGDGGFRSLGRDLIGRGDFEISRVRSSGKVHAFALRQAGEGFVLEASKDPFSDGLAALSQGSISHEGQVVHFRYRSAGRSLIERFEGWRAVTARLQTARMSLALRRAARSQAEVVGRGLISGSPVDVAVLLLRLAHRLGIEEEDVLHHAGLPMARRQPLAGPLKEFAGREGGALADALRRLPFVESLPPALFRAGVLTNYPPRILSNDQRKMAAEFAAAFESEGVPGVRVLFHREESLAKNPDLNVLAPFYTGADGVPTFSVDLRLSRAFIFLKGEDRPRLLKALVRREIGRADLDDADQKDLKEWIDLFLLPVWEVSPPLPPAVRRVLYLSGAQALRLSDPRSPYTERQEKMMGGRPSLQKIAHILWHVVRVTDASKWAERWNRMCPDAALSGPEIETFMISGAAHDIGKLHPDLIHIFLSPEKFKLESAERKELDLHEEKSLALSRELGFRLDKEHEDVLLMLNMIWSNRQEELDKLVVLAKAKPKAFTAALLLALLDVYDGYLDPFRPYHLDLGPGKTPSRADITRELHRKLSPMLRIPFLAPLVEKLFVFAESLHQDEEFIRFMERTSYQSAFFMARERIDAAGPLTPEARLDIVLDSVRRHALITLRTPASIWWPMLVQRALLSGVADADIRETVRAVARAFLARATGLEEEAATRMRKAAASGIPEDLMVDRSALLAVFPAGDVTPLEATARAAVEAYLGLPAGKLGLRHIQMIRRRARMLRLEDSVLHLGARGSLLPLIDAALGARSVLVSEHDVIAMERFSLGLEELMKDPRFQHLRGRIQIREHPLNVDFLREELDGIRFDQAVLWNPFSAAGGRAIFPARLLEMNAIRQVVGALEPAGRLWVSDRSVDGNGGAAKRSLLALEKAGEIGLSRLPASDGAVVGSDGVMGAYEVSPAPKRARLPGDAFRGMLLRFLPRDWVDEITVKYVPPLETMLLVSILHWVKASQGMGPLPTEWSWFTAALWAGLWMTTTVGAVLLHLPGDLLEGNIRRLGFRQWVGERTLQMLRLTAPTVFLPWHVGGFVSLTTHWKENADAVETLRADPASTILPASIFPPSLLKAWIDRIRGARGDEESLKRLLFDMQVEMEAPDQLAEALLSVAEGRRSDDPLHREVMAVLEERVVDNPPSDHPESLRRALLRLIGSQAAAPSLRTRALESLMIRKSLLSVREQAAIVDELRRISNSLLPMRTEILAAIAARERSSSIPPPLRERRIISVKGPLSGADAASRSVRWNGRDTPLKADVQRLSTILRRGVAASTMEPDAGLPRAIREAMTVLLVRAAGKGPAIRWEEPLQRLNALLLRKGFHVGVDFGRGTPVVSPRSVDRILKFQRDGRHVAVLGLRGLEAGDDGRVNEMPLGHEAYSFDRIEREALEVVLPGMMCHFGDAWGVDLPLSTRLAAARLIIGDLKTISGGSQNLQDHLTELADHLRVRASAVGRIRAAIRAKLRPGESVHEGAYWTLPLYPEDDLLDEVLQDADRFGVPHGVEDLESASAGLARKPHSYQEAFDALLSEMADGEETAAAARGFLRGMPRSEEASLHTRLSLSATPGTDLVILYGRLMDPKSPLSEEERAAIISVFQALAVPLRVTGTGAAMVRDVLERLADPAMQSKMGVLQEKFLPTFFRTEDVERARADSFNLAGIRSLKSLERLILTIGEEPDAEGRSWFPEQLIEMARAGADLPPFADTSPLHGLSSKVRELRLKDKNVQRKESRRKFEALGLRLIKDGPKGLMPASASLYRWARARSPRLGALFAFGLGASEEVVRFLFESAFDFSLLGAVGYALLFATVLHAAGVVMKDGTFKSLPWNDLSSEERRSLFRGALVLGLIGLSLRAAGLEPWQSYLVLGVLHGLRNLAGESLWAMNLPSPRIRTLSNVLERQELAKVTRIVYPAGDGDFPLLALLAKSFPNLKEIRVIDIKALKPGTHKKPWRADGRDLRLVEEKEDYFTQAALPPTDGVTLFIDKIPGTEGYMRADTRFRTAVIRDSRSGDLVLSLPASMNPSLQWTQRLADGISIPDYKGREGFLLWRLTEGDAAVAAQSASRLAPVLAGFPDFLNGETGDSLLSRFTRLMRVLRANDLASLSEPVESWWPLVFVRAFALHRVPALHDKSLLRKLGEALDKSPALAGDEGLRRKARAIRHKGYTSEFSLNRAELERMMDALAPAGREALVRESLLGGAAASRTLSVERFEFSMKALAAQALEDRSDEEAERDAFLASFNLGGLAAFHQKEEGDAALISARQKRDVALRLRAAGNARAARVAAENYNRAMGFKSAADVLVASSNALTPVLFELSPGLLAGNTDELDRRQLALMRQAADAGCLVDFLLPSGADVPAARAALDREGFRKVFRGARWARKDQTVVDVGLHSVEKLLRLTQGEKGALQRTHMFVLDRREWQVEPSIEDLVELLMDWGDGWVRNVTQPLADGVRHLNLAILTQA